MRDSIIASLAAPALLCIKVNTSYADPPKMQQRLSLSHEIHCGAVLLSPGSRTSAASLADSRGLRCDLGGSAQIELDLPEEAARKFNDERPLQECCHPVSCR
jgi:hypothetical protein